MIQNDIFDHQTKVVLAGIKRRKFNSFKRTQQFKDWKRRQYDVIQRRKCAYCRKSIHYKKLHIDHVYPLYEGGRNETRNLVLSCPRCNIKKWVSTPGKPLWITQREQDLTRKKQLSQLRNQQHEQMLQLIGEEEASLVAWIE